MCQLSGGIVRAAYLFEVRQIQRYILSTGKLRDASGASELIDGLCNDDGAADGPSVGGIAGDLIGHLLKDPVVYRAAGGALDLTHGSLEALRQFRAAFRLEIARRAPGLVFSDAVESGGTDDEARAKARNAMSDGGPITGVRLPLGSPIVRPAPRSGGNPAILQDRAPNGRCVITNEYADLATLMARAYLEDGREGLAAKFLPGTSSGKGLKWPTVFAMDDDSRSAKSKRTVVFPFRPKMIPRIAVLHADGNGMGAIFSRAVELAQKPGADQGSVRKLSLALAAATRDAVRKAMEPVTAAEIDGVIPARPIVLGGDDVSLILRADLAPGFALDFTRAFEELATEAVKPFDVLEPGKRMTTKVGFVTIGANQPFNQAYALAESLASSARSPSESRIAFHRIAGATIAGSASELAEDGLGAGGYMLWRAAHSREDFKRLIVLSETLGHEDVGRGGLRRVAELLKSDHGRAKDVYERALVILRDRNATVAAELSKALADLGMDGLDARPGTGGPTWCPLLQAHDLSHIFGRAA